MSDKSSNTAHQGAMKVETFGIETIPKEARTGKPSDLSIILIGANLALSLIVIGWFPVAFGLGWWGASTALMVGVLAAAIVLAPASLFGARSGTNNSVSSGALFGVRGRVIGSMLGVLLALGYVALAVWTSGDALVAAVHRLFGIPLSFWSQGVSYALVGSFLIFIAIYGFRLLVLAQKIMIPVMGTVMVLGVVAFWPQFDSSYAGGDYLLGSFWATWVLSAILGFSTIIGYGPFVGDWSRYLSSEKYSDVTIMRAMFVGTVLGMGAAFLFGAFTAVSFSDPTAAYATSLVQEAPIWYVFPLIILAIGAGAAQGATGLYGTGLDTSSLLPVLKRVPATTVLGGIAMLLVYLGVFFGDVVDNVSAFITLLAILTVPWLAILYYGLWWRKGFLDPEAVQVVGRGQSGGRYWFWRGLNLRALVPWCIAATMGLLFSATELYTGPFAYIAGGIDLAPVVAGITGLVLYPLSLAIYPEPPAAFANTVSPQTYVSSEEQLRASQSA